MAAYTAEQLATIAQQMKSAQNLPQYYSASTGQYITISRDFEAYLILQPQSQKQQILQWIQSALALQNTQLDRDVLLSRYINLRITDSNNVMNDLNNDVLNGFSQMQAGLLDGDQASNLTSNNDLNELASSLQAPVDEYDTNYDSAYHENTVMSTLLSRLQQNSYTQAQKQELQSWQTVISAYPGSSSSVGTPPSAVPAGGTIPV